MRRTIRKHMRDFVAIAFMAIIGLTVASYILSNQRLYLPDWVPVVGTDFYEVEVELQNAQAVVPGQGQTVNIAGVKVGEIGKVELEDGRAVVQLKLKKKYAPVYRDATALLRPKTGLKDMYLNLEPGTQSAGELPEGARIPVSNTLPDVNPDEVLAALDTDTRDYLRVLLGVGGEALGDQASQADLREALKRFEPTSRDAEKATALLSERRRNLRRVVHNFQLLSTEVAGKDRQLAGLVDSANANFEALASEEVSLRGALRQLPGTLDQTTQTLTKVGNLSDELGPAAQALRPGARALGPALRETRPFLRKTTPVIKNQLRPFARDVRPTVRDLRRASVNLNASTPRLVKTFDWANRLLNTLAYNPPGSEEGFLFWLAWTNHAATSVFAAQDAHGPIRRGLVLVSCSALGVLDQLKTTTPQLDVLVQLLNAPRQSSVCPGAVP